jgi:hypothetical protein
MHTRTWAGLPFLGLIVLLAGRNIHAQELQSFDCSAEAKLKSINGDTPTSVDFVNQTADEVDVYWLDYSGKRVLYNKVPSGYHYVQQTYLTHPWVVTNSAGTCLAIFQPLAGQHTALMCGVPDSEKTEEHGWSKGTTTKFKQTLEPAKADFVGRIVKEQDPGGGTDTCWVKGFPFDPTPLTAVSGGKWTVEKGNIWADDYVGIGGGLILHYRQEGRTPCGMHIPQRMVISCGQTFRAYLTDTLKIIIGKTDIVNERAGVQATKTWP